MTSSRRLPPVLLILTLGLFPFQQAHAETVIRKSISYFQIGGKTASDIDAELARKGPTTQATGARHPGVTRIRFGGDVTFVLRASRCAIAETRVTLDTKLILPRWKNRKRASPDMAVIWDALSSDIKRHEERHAEIARQHARELDAALKALPPERDCDLLQDKIALATDRITQAHDRAQQQFDRIESINFENRIQRIIQHRLDATTNR